MFEFIIELLGVIFIIFLIIYIVSAIKDNSPKKINSICNNIYDNSLTITEKLNNLLKIYGYEPTTDNEMTTFCAVSSMYCYYFFILALRKHYGASNKICSTITKQLLGKLSANINNISFEQISNIYLEITSTLIKTPQNNYEELEKYVGLCYLNHAINFKGDEVETDLLLNIYEEFNIILKNSYKIY